MIYDIKAIPTRYNGTMFRSRLEARWAAFFDLCGWQWDYEPIDLDGWCPDFSLSLPPCTVMAEVKPLDPTDMTINPSFAKAARAWDRQQVLLLGLKPREHSFALGVGALMDSPKDIVWQDVHDCLCVRNEIDLWREAGNRVQWKGRD